MHRMPLLRFAVCCSGGAVPGAEEAAAGRRAEEGPRSAGARARRDRPASSARPGSREGPTPSAEGQTAQAKTGNTVEYHIRDFSFLLLANKLSYIAFRKFLTRAEIHIAPLPKLHFSTYCLLNNMLKKENVSSFLIDQFR